ncbi:MAG TPA: hypothetical protein VM305_04965 [Candidatus Limnocylindrales bacterium]|nr:hypothetical protein [Candidatus Limnocylindrales bacterium]
MSRTLLALGGVAGAAVVVVIVGVLALGLNADRPGMGGQPSPPPTSGPTLQPTAEPTAQPSPTATPRPTRTPEADLPVGPFEVEDFGTVMTVTIPTSGWTFGDEWNGLVKGVERDNMPEAQIVFWTHPGVSEFDVYGDPCQWASTTPETVTTVHDFAAALAAQASRDASEPTDVTIGGVAGKSVVLHVPDDVEFSDCDQGRFASYGRAGANEPDRWHQGPGQIDQFWILDVDGTFVTIQAMWRPDTSAELVEEMRGIVESTTFEVP